MKKKISQIMFNILFVMFLYTGKSEMHTHTLHTRTHAQTCLRECACVCVNVCVNMCDVCDVCEYVWYV